MPGTAKTNDFMLGTATVMIGDLADLYDLNPTDHSVGLVKNFVMTSEPTYTELTQGVKNTIVASVMTQNPVRCTMEAYEFTAKNMAYALGIEGASDITANTVVTAVNGAVTGGPAVFTVNVDSAAGITVGSYIMIMVDNEDNFIVRKVTTIATNTLTVSKALPSIPDNAVVRKVNMIEVGSKDDQPYYSAKVAGKLASGEEIVLLIPKIRIVRGFNLAFKSDDFGNLPIELTVYDLVSTDSFFADFGGASAQIYKK